MHVCQSCDGLRQRYPDLYVACQKVDLSLPCHLVTVCCVLFSEREEDQPAPRSEMFQSLMFGGGLDLAGERAGAE